MSWQKSIRARVKGAPAQYLPLLRANGGSRKKAVDFICSIGGYSSRHSRYAVEFNVKAYGCNLDVDTMYSHSARGDFGIYEQCTNDGERGLLYNLFRAHHAEEEENLWQRATEDAWRSFEDDDNTFWGEPLDTKFHLVGRSGGHLVISECGGLNVECSDDDLRERLMEREEPDAYSGKFGPYVLSDEKVMHLFLVCVQITVDWPRQAVDREVEHHAACGLWSSFDEGDFKNLLAVHRAPDRTVDDKAGEVLDSLLSQEDTTLSACFVTVCQMAGVNFKEN